MLSTEAHTVIKSEEIFPQGKLSSSSPFDSRFHLTFHWPVMSHDHAQTNPGQGEWNDHDCLRLTSIHLKTHPKVQAWEKVIDDFPFLFQKAPFNDTCNLTM